MKTTTRIACIILMLSSPLAFSQNSKLDNMPEEEWAKLKILFFVFNKIFEPTEASANTQTILAPIFPWDYAVKYKSNSTATFDSLSKSMEYKLADVWGKTDIRIYNYFPMSISAEQAELYSLNVLKTSIVRNDIGDTISHKKFGYRSSDKLKSKHFSIRGSNNSGSWEDEGQRKIIYLTEKNKPINSRYNLTSTIALGEGDIKPKGVLHLEINYITGYNKVLVSKKDINKTFILNNIPFKILDTNATGIVVQCNDIDKLKSIPLNVNKKPFVSDFPETNDLKNANVHIPRSNTTQQYELYWYLNRNRDTSMTAFKAHVKKMEEIKQNPKLKKEVSMIYFERNYAFVYFYMPIYTTRRLKLDL